MSILGCATTGMEINVTRFHEMGGCDSNINYAFVPYETQRESLEHQAYVDLVKQKLMSCGHIVNDPNDASRIVFVNYGIDTGREQVSSTPIIGQTGSLGSTTTGSAYTSGGYTTISATTRNIPTYGVIGSVASSETEYRRTLSLDIYQKKAINDNAVKKIYEGKAVSIGSTGTLAIVMPNMVKAIFIEFPGKNRSVSEYNLSLK